MQQLFFFFVCCDCNWHSCCKRWLRSICLYICNIAWQQHILSHAWQQSYALLSLLCCCCCTWRAATCSKLAIYERGKILSARACVFTSFLFLLLIRFLIALQYFRYCLPLWLILLQSFFLMQFYYFILLFHIILLQFFSLVTGVLLQVLSETYFIGAL